MFHVKSDFSGAVNPYLPRSCVETVGSPVFPCDHIRF